MSLDILAIRRQFPFLKEKAVYFDSAATAQKPQVVLDALRDFYQSTANVHRGVHAMTEKATQAYEDARDTMRAFINARHSDEIIFTRNTTEGINLVARSWGETFLKKDDIVVLSILEHHSNIVPWLQLKEKIGIEVKWIDIDDDGTMKMNELDEVLATKRVKLVSMTGQSNVLGVRPPIDQVIRKAHAAGALVVIDAAQLIAHAQVDVQDLDADFLAFSGHKLYGPAGMGVLYAKRNLLKLMPPFLGGGMMIRSVTKDGFSPADAPQKFEAGTMPAGEAVALKAAIDWLSQFSWGDCIAHEQLLMTHAVEQLQTIDGLKILGSPAINELTNQQINARSGCLSFTIDNIHPHDLTDILGQKGFSLRAGHHCTQLLHQRLGINASTRVSFGIYNTIEEIDALIPAIKEACDRLN